MSKVSIERITKIVRLIHKRRAAPMAYLMSELEVSQASVKRDLDFLRDRLGCPLDWDRKKLVFTNHAEASKTIVRREYRTGFEPVRMG